MRIHAADLVIIALVLFGGYRGWRNGLSGELIRVAGIVVAFVFASRFHVVAGEWIAARTSLTGAAARTVAFTVPFVGFWLAAFLVRIVVHKIMTISFVPHLEKAGGIVAGMLKMAVIVSGILVFISLAPRLRPLADTISSHSVICSFLSEHAPAFYSSLQERYGLETDGADETGEAPPSDPQPPDPQPPEPEPPEADLPPEPPAETVPAPEPEPDEEPRWEPLVFEPLDGAQDPEPR